MLRARQTKAGEQTYSMEEVKSCAKILSQKKQHRDLVTLLVAHGQASEDLAVFLYSVLDVPVSHAFILNTKGELNMKNFQRFEGHAKSESLTVLNSVVKIMDVSKYDRLRTLIMVSCGMLRITLDSLPCVELIDVRYNRLSEIPQSVSRCKNLKTLKVAYNQLRSLPDISGLKKTLIWLDCSHNFLKKLPPGLVKCVQLINLFCDHNQLTELPLDLGLLSVLEDLTLHNNKISQLPLSVAAMTHLSMLTFRSNPLQNIPGDFPERPTDVREYLNSLQEDPIPNNTIKLVLVGQEGVGKTTLLKALKRTFWAIPRSPTTTKTDGIAVKDIQLDELTLRCFDCGGDVDFNETHNFFITQGALYLACFNLAEYCLSTVERSSFLLGRLQLWLQYIFSKVPSAQVVMVGTHADHDTMSRNVFEEIWEQLRALMISARPHHRSYFRGERLPDCLLCQSDSRCLRRSTSTGQAGFVNLGFDNVQSQEDETSFSDKTGNMITFPHIMGYYEVSSVKSLGNTGSFQFSTNQSIEHLKVAITSIAQKMMSNNPEIPRRWASVRESLKNHSFNNLCVASLSEVSEIARAHSISGRTELLHMLHFLKAQGSVLYFPQLEALEDTVILDPEWLAKVFSTVVSFRDTGINNDGFIENGKLIEAWGDLQGPVKDQILDLLHHFGLCLPMADSKLELFPCKLPIGEPDDMTWPLTPPPGCRQLTYSVTFPSLIPPPLFSDLIVAVFRYRADVSSDKARYYANHIVDVLRVDRIGCKDCKMKPETPKDNDPSLLHQVHFELVPHQRTINLTVRGTLPCCTIRKAGRVLNKVVTHYEGLCSITLDSLVCPGCHTQSHPEPHKFNPKRLLAEHKAGDKMICSNGHTLPDVRGILTGVMQESCMPSATLKMGKTAKEKADFSGCPKLFIILPVNKDGLSFDEKLSLFVSSLVLDGFAAHFLCEFPDGYHLCNSPGYRLKDPKDFMAKFGQHVIAVLRLLSHLSGSSLTTSHLTKALSVNIPDLIKDLTTRYPGVKDSSSKMRPDQVVKLVSEKSKKFKREDLRKQLHVADKSDSFGPLRRLNYADNFLWLCSDHYKQLKVLSIGTMGPHTNKESLA